MKGKIIPKYKPILHQMDDMLGTAGFIIFRNLSMILLFLTVILWIWNKIKEKHSMRKLMVEGVLMSELYVALRVSIEEIITDLKFYKPLLNYLGEDWEFDFEEDLVIPKLRFRLIGEEDNYVICEAKIKSDHDPYKFVTLKLTYFIQTTEEEYFRDKDLWGIYAGITHHRYMAPDAYIFLDKMEISSPDFVDEAVPLPLEVLRYTWWSILDETINVRPLENYLDIKMSEIVHSNIENDQFEFMREYYVTNPEIDEDFFVRDNKHRSEEYYLPGLTEKERDDIRKSPPGWPEEELAKLKKRK
jgi:hypothetical protein